MKFLTYFISFWLLLGPLWAHAEAGKVVYSKGKVKVHRKSGKKMMVKTGFKLAVGDTIFTHQDGLAILKLADHSTVKLNGGSKVLIGEVDGIDKKDSTSLYFHAGSLFAKVATDKKKKKEKFMIKTKSVSMGVRGTEFFAAYGDKKERNDVWMCVNEGEVKVHTDNKESAGKIVKAGEGIKAENKPKGEVTDPKKLPWTKNLNWNFDPEKGEVENKVDIKEAYSDPLDIDYD